MAMVIPPEGETSDCPGPQDENAIRVILGADMISKAPADDGSTWWYAFPSPPGATVNERASRFLNSRNTKVSSKNSYALYGKVLYVSPDETRKLNHTREVWVPVHGRTFPVKDNLKTLGARWDPNVRQWMVPQSKLDQADEIVRKGP